MESHHDRIRDQFTRQAEAFATAPPIRDEAALRLILATSDVQPTDTVLDVACGPGIVTCAFAAAVVHATGIDLTPAMLGQARRLQAERRLTNVDWCVGDVARLPFPDAGFSVVVSRFALHHMEAPAAVFGEMVRACRPGGRVVVVDVAVSDVPAQAAAFNAMEKRRDPSHVRALTLAELEALFREAGLPEPRRAFYRMNVPVKGLLARSCPNPGDDLEIHALFEASLADDALGVDARRVGDDIRFDYKIAVLVAART